MMDLLPLHLLHHKPPRTSMASRWGDTHYHGNVPCSKICLEIWTLLGLFSAGPPPPPPHYLDCYVHILSPSWFCKGVGYAARPTLLQSITCPAVAQVKSWIVRVGSAVVREWAQTPQEAVKAEQWSIVARSSTGSYPQHRQTINGYNVTQGLTRKGTSFSSYSSFYCTCRKFSLWTKDGTEEVLPTECDSRQEVVVRVLRCWQDQDSQV